jgi:hypothetical protein
MAKRPRRGLRFDSRQDQRDTIRVNTQAKIALPPLDFDEFNALDVLVNGEIAELVYQGRTYPQDAARERERRERLLRNLRAMRAKIDACRPPQYAAAIRAARAETVCDT